MLNAKTGMLLALAGVLVGHYAYLHDLLIGKQMIEMGPASWGLAAVGFVAALAGLWLLRRGEDDMAQ